MGCENRIFSDFYNKMVPFSIPKFSSQFTNHQSQKKCIFAD